MSGIGNAWSQMFPPKPSFTEADLPDLAGKVYIVTGANVGVGKALTELLYGKDAKVYVAARSPEKAAAAIEAIKTTHPSSKGELVFLKLDLADLSTIKASAEEFLRKEPALHVLFNNAGVMTPPQGSKSAQGYELQLGTNNLGTYLFTKLVTPALAAAARTAPPSTVRVVWVSSSAAEYFSPKPHGVDMSNLDYHSDKSPQHKYGVSKAGNYLHATAYARAHAADGIVSVALNPGNLQTELARHRSGLERVMLKLILHPAVYGAYTELFAGLSPEVTTESVKEHDYWIVPWGRFAPLRADLVAAGKSEKEGGSGVGDKFTEWTEEQIKTYV